MSKILVLGAGMVGSAMAIDLVKDHDISVADLNDKALRTLKKSASKINTLKLDVTNHKALNKIIKPFDLIICAVPGFLGYKTLEQLILAKKDVVDISFFPENSLDLHELALKNRVTAIVDCGVAPGMDNYILGYYDKKLKLTDFECLVGGLPKVKKWPFSYKAPFSPIDVIEEYTRPARYIENGELIVREALTDCEYVEFEKVGTLEAFNSDGLRSIIFTMPHIANMKEKTLRYPNHVEYIRVLKESGFFNEKKILIDGHEISPLDFTSKILFKEWKLQEDEEEITVMRVMVKGKNSEGKIEKVTYTLYDEYCKDTKTSSMARSTGYTATATANMFLEGLFKEKGVYPPELIGRDKACFEYVLSYLKARNVLYKRSTEILN